MMRCLLRNILVSLILFSIICSCDNSRKQDRLETVSVDSITELPLPSVPSGITTTEDRAAFVARHFWDALDFRSDPLAVDTAFMEQNFANFISVLAVTPQDRTGEAVQGLCKMALGNPDAFSLLESVAEKYLDDPNSPMRNEDLFILFLQDWESSDSVGEATRERAKFRLARAMKNRRGTLAADFRFVDRQGRETTLFKSLGTAATLLMFYDPDCPQCEETKKAIAASQEAEGVRVVAIDIAGDRRLWDETKAAMPPAWTVGYALDPLEEEETYVFPALPTLYLLDPTGRVLLKDPPLNLLLNPNPVD